jgi:two-component system aerobic respiration control sensor histidine kinase ArcB
MRKPKTFKITSDNRTEFLDFSTLSRTAVIFLSLDLNVLDFNEVTESLYQWKREEILNKSYLRWCDEHQLSSPIVVEDLEFLSEGFPKLNVENTINIDSFQHVLMWQIVVNLNKDNVPCEVVLIGEDVTHLKSYMNQMKNLADVSKKITGHDMGSNRTASEYFSNVYLYLENIISCMPCYVYWKDVDFVYLGCNELSAKLLKLNTKKDIVGKTDYDFGVPKEIADAYRKIDEEIIRTGKPQLNIEEYHQIEGDSRELLGNKMPIFNENGKIIGLVGIAVDITERKKWEKELIKAKEAAESANKLKSEFIHNMEHDIRTPFVGILGITNILEELETDSTKKQMILDIYFCAQELLEYSCGILDFSRIDAGEFPVNSRKFDINELVNSIAFIETPAAKMKGLDFRVEFDTDVPSFLIGDEYRLKRILINLLSNAIKFTPKGYVKLTVKSLKKERRNILLNFIVEDSGIGIKKEKLNTIYEKFGRLMPSNQGLYKGHGFGLRIVKQFVEEMEGDIEINSTLGEGSQFICTLSFKLPLFEGVSVQAKELPYG